MPPLRQRFRAAWRRWLFLCGLVLTTSAQAQSADPMDALLQDFYSRLAPVYGAPTLPGDAPAIGSGGTPSIAAPTGDPTRRARNRSPENRLPDGTSLLLTVRLDRDRLVDPLLVYTEGTGFRVPLDVLVKAFEFPILVDAAAGRAEGWFIRPENDFSLDMDAATLTSRGRSIPVRPDDVIRRDGALLVGDWVLPAWFGLEAAVNMADLEVAIQSEELLPAQARQRREQRFAQNRSFNVPKAELPPAPNAAPLVGPPVVDLFASGRLTHSDSQGLDSGGLYAATVASDLLGGSFTAYLSGSEQEPLSSLRANLSYYDADGLDGLGLITQARFGDTSGLSTSLLAPSASGQGLYLSNLPIGAQIRTDITNISGDALPGYEVELYRDEQLVGYQRVGADGQYNFENVEMYAGDNEFRLVLYGPQGQREEILRTVANGGGLGDVPLTYQFAASRIDSGPDEGGFQSSLSTRLAVSDWFAFLSGVSTTESYGEGISDALVGAQIRDGRLLAEGLIGRDTVGRTVGRALVQTRIDTTALRLSHQVQPETLRYIEGQEVGNRERTEASVSGLLPGSLLDLPYLRYTLQAERLSDATFEESLSVSSRLGTQIGRVSLNNDLAWVRASTRTTDRAIGREETDIRIFHQASFPVGRLRNRVRLGYDVAPEVELNELQLNTTWLMDPKLTSDFDLRHQFDTDRTVAQARVNYDMDTMILSPRIAYDSTGLIGAFLDLRVSMGAEPLTGRIRTQSRPAANDGSVAVLVFLDSNGNGVFDETEERLEGVEVQAPQARRSALTRTDGVAVLRNVQPFEASDVRIIPSSLPATSLMPGIEGYSLSVLPGGSRSLELPVVRSWEVEGQVWSVRANGAGTALPGVQVVVRSAEDDSIVASTTTLGDGSYSIANLRQGRYRVALAPEMLAAARLTPGPARPFATDLRETTYHGVDLIALPAGQQPTYPPLERAAGLGPLMLPLGSAFREAATPEPAASTRMVIAVRLGQYRSRLALILGWDALIEEAGPLVGGLTPILSRREEERLLSDRTSLYPLRLGPLADRDQAELLCDRLRSLGRSCVPTLIEWQQDMLASAATVADQAVTSDR